MKLLTVMVLEQLVGRLALTGWGWTLRLERRIRLWRVGLVLAKIFPGFRP